MARIVYVTSGLVGILNSGLEMADRLRAAGHDVSFIGWRDNREQVEAQGYEFVRLDGDERAIAELRSHEERRGRIRSLGRARRLRRGLIRSTEVEDALLASGADLLIVDIEVHTAIIAARALGLPMITRMDFLSVYRNWDLPPLHTTMSVPSSWSERLRCRLAWVGVLARPLVGSTVGQLRPRRLRHRKDRPGS